MLPEPHRHSDRPRSHTGGNGPLQRGYSGIYGGGAGYWLNSPYHRPYWDEVNPSGTGPYAEVVNDSEPGDYLTADLGEDSDVADERPAVADSRRTMLLGMLEESGAKWPRINPRYDGE